MDREAWCAVIHGNTKSWTRLSNLTELKLEALGSYGNSSYTFFFWHKSCIKESKNTIKHTEHVKTAFLGVLAFWSVWSFFFFFFFNVVICLVQRNLGLIIYQINFACPCFLSCFRAGIMICGFSLPGLSLLH